MYSKDKLGAMMLRINLPKKEKINGTIRITNLLSFRINLIF